MSRSNKPDVSITKQSASLPVGLAAQKLLIIGQKISTGTAIEKTLYTGISRDDIDDKFVSKLRTLRSQLSSISQKKRRKLGQLGIGVLRQTATVEDLVDALLIAANS